MTRHLFAAAGLLALAAVQAEAAMEPVDYVSTLVGTQSSFALSTGNTYPATAMPWGMNFWVAQTGKNGDGWQYTYDAHKIRGLKQTHQPSPWINDYGMFSIMPETGRAVADEEQRASWFSHKAETAKPYYYKVYLADYDVVAEVAPTERAAMLRFTFPETDSAFVMVDAYHDGSYVKILPAERRVIGWSTHNSGGVAEGFRCYFVIEFDKAFSYTATASGAAITPGSTEREADHAGAIIGFSTRRGEVVHARVASSFISAEQALRNLGELGTRSFDQVAAAGRQRWNDVLGRIEVEDRDIDHLRTFYSCLYRSVLFPRALYERDGEGNPIHRSPYNGQVLPGYMYGDTGFWDTFRALFPLLNLVYPSTNSEVQDALANAYRESGFLPEWSSPGHRGCMVGNNSASVVADAWLSGVRSKDIETLWQAVTHDAHAVHPTVSSTGRLGWEYYDKLGYVPYDVKINENVARTLEYAYDDWCIYRLGRSLGKSKKELAPYARRAMNYRQVFDPETRLMRGRMQDGSWQKPFNPLKWGDAFTEGNSWHYTWSVFHDPAGLIQLMGGEQPFVAMMDSVFGVPPLFDDSYYGQVIHEIREMQVMNMGNYAHGNQPVQHMIYLYAYARQPWKTQLRIRQVMDRFYTAAPDGYCGDEDNGQTSAWYVFSALGFYPVCPGSGQYVLGTPYFDRVRVHLENGKTLDIHAADNSEENVYVQSLSIDGQPYTKNYVERDALLRGLRMDYQMAPRPNLGRGTGEGDVPYSFSKEKQYPAPRD